MSNNIIQFPKQEKGEWIEVILTQDELVKMELISLHTGKSIEQLVGEMFHGEINRLESLTDEELEAEIEREEFADKYGKGRPFLKVL